MTEAAINHLLEPIPEESSYLKTDSFTFDHSQDSISSADGTHFWSVSLDDTPILPAIDGQKVKSFDDLIEEALKKQENLTNQINHDNSVKPKKPFLKRGAGLVRFAPKANESGNRRRRCCSKKLEKEFKDKPECSLKTVDQYPQLNGCVQNESLDRCDNTPKKKFFSKQAPRKLKVTDEVHKALPKRNSKQQTNFKPNQIQPTLNKSSKNQVNQVKSSEILSRYSHDFERIQRAPSNSVISCEFKPKKTSPKTTVKPNGATKKVNFQEEESRVEVLERLLNNIKAKQQQIQQKALESQSEEESWEDDSDESDLVEEMTKNSILSKNFSRNKVKRSGTFTLGKHGSSTSKDSGSNTLAKPRISNYTLALKNKIEALEGRLKQLNVNFDRNLENYKTCKASNKTIPSPSSPDTTSERLFSEMTEIKKYLSSLTSKLEMIETKLITKETPSSKLRINIPSCSAKILAPTKTSLYSQIMQMQTGTHLTLDNGDQIMKAADNTIIYNYASGVKQVTYPDGTRVVEFPSGQIERITIYGTKTIFYPNNTQRIIRPDGSEETITPDGTVIRITTDGTEIIELSNGEREIRTKEFKRREYLDGTIKTVHSDGTEETRYANGRLRIKDKSGKLIADSLITQLRGLS